MTAEQARQRCLDRVVEVLSGIALLRLTVPSVDWERATEHLTEVIFALGGGRADCERAIQRGVELIRCYYAQDSEDQ